jgi:hypothetical protein
VRAQVGASTAPEVLARNVLKATRCRASYWHAMCCMYVRAMDSLSLQCMYVCMYNPRKLRGVNLYPAATGGPARAHSSNRFWSMFMSYVRADREEVDVRMGGGSTTHSQDGRNSQTRTACPTESPRRTPELLFQSIELAFDVDDLFSLAEC